MDELRYTLVTEGRSDIALMPILDWMLQENGVSGALQGEWADLSWAPVSGKMELAVKIREAVRLYPCDLLFVHRDADRTSREKRVAEIETAVADLVFRGLNTPIVVAVAKHFSNWVNTVTKLLTYLRPIALVASEDDAWQEQMRPVICVAPVRMQEAWLLIDEMAIRQATGNKNGQVPLELPPLNQIEALPDPKQRLYDLLKQASGLSGRRLKKFRPNEYAWRVSEYIEDFSPLRNLSAFVALENQLRNTLEERGG